MQAITQTITATFTEQAVAEEWVAFLREQQIDEMLANGASEAEILRVDNPSIMVEVRYRFASRSAFNLFQLNHGAKQMALMLSKFPPTRGVNFERSIAKIETEAGAAAPASENSDKKPMPVLGGL